MYNFTNNFDTYHLNLTRGSWGYHLTVADGIKFIFENTIDGWTEPICQGVKIPEEHMDWK